MRVAITNLELWPPSGTVTYVRDLALELVRQGHAVTVFSVGPGDIADTLRAAGIAVIGRLARAPWKPDIIHGHHYVPTLLALRHWPGTPAIHICHDYTLAADRTPLHPAIRRHFGVSQVCVGRLIDEGVAPGRVALLPNFVDTTRFVPRPPLPGRARRAMILSNYATEQTHLPAVRAACRSAGIELDVVGAGVGRIETNPEKLLPAYDLVFAKGKAALEAMAVGAAVVLCDFAGAGPMIRSEQFDALRAVNFGFEALDRPLTASEVERQIALYDPADAALVSARVRRECGLVAAVERLIAIYGEAIDAPRDTAPHPGAIRSHLSVGNLASLRLHWALRSMPLQMRQRIKQIPGVARALPGAVRAYDRMRRVLDRQGR